MIGSIAKKVTAKERERIAKLGVTRGLTCSFLLHLAAIGSFSNLFLIEAATSIRLGAIQLQLAAAWAEA